PRESNDIMDTNTTYLNGLKAIQEQDFQKAATLLSQVLEEDSTHFNARFNRAMAYSKLQQFDKAIEDFHACITQEPEKADAHSELAICHFMNGDAKNSLAHFTHAIKLEPRNPFRYSSRAFIKDRLKDYKGAIADYERAIELDPEDAISYNNKGLVEEKLGRKEKAKKSFAKADSLEKPGKKKSLNEKHRNKKKHKELTPLQKNKTQKTNDAPRQTASKPQVSQKLTLRLYLKTLKSVLFSQKERQAFAAFVKNLLKGNGKK
ncbi:MAG: tetratricopeptide repeat protein, partial [Cytophagales bacterium]|nr:tetratricopeptide repeat protein [Cytophagales bacterium]